MSRFLITRRAGLLSATAAAAVLGTTGPALADATVSPAAVVQGSGDDLTFHVTNTDPKPISRIKLVLPADSPIAEVYPLSVDDWAPLITSQKLQTPLATIHGGIPTTETAAAITWIAMPGRTLAPGQSTDLTVSVGPMPTLSEMKFTVQASHVDGTPAVAMAPVTLQLTEATAQDQAALEAAHSGHGGAGTTADGTDTSADDSAFAAVVAQGDQGPGFWSVTGWILAALAAAGALITVIRGRRRAVPAGAAAEPTEDAADTAEDSAGPAKETVGAGAAGKVRSGWRYQQEE